MTRECNVLKALEDGTARTEWAALKLLGAPKGMPRPPIRLNCKSMQDRRLLGLRATTVFKSAAGSCDAALDSALVSTKKSIRPSAILGRKGDKGKRRLPAPAIRIFRIETTQANTSSRWLDSSLERSCHEELCFGISPTASDAQNFSTIMEAANAAPASLRWSSSR